MAAMTELLGEDKPVGFRPPGFKISPWTEDILERHGIQYISVVDKREQSLPISFPTWSEVSRCGSRCAIKRLKRQPVNDYQTDAYYRSQIWWLLGKHDAATAYDIAYQRRPSTSATSRTSLGYSVAHPMNRVACLAPALKSFSNDCMPDFGSNSFKEHATLFSLDPGG